MNAAYQNKEVIGKVAYDNREQIGQQVHNNVGGQFDQGVNSGMNYASENMYKGGPPPGDLEILAGQHIKTKVLVVDENDKLFWFYVTNVPKMPIHFAALAAVLNLLIPGLGTIFCACYTETYVSKT